jgi:hypothetical protein
MPHDMDTNKTFLTIAHAQAKDNPVGSLQFTADELKRYARQAYSKGATIEEIISTTKYAQSTIYAWLQDLMDTKKTEKNGSF